MLLRNFDRTMATFMTGTNLYSFGAQQVYGPADTRVLSTSGGIPTSPIDYGAPISLSYQSICIGDGTQEVQYTDYRLSGSTIGSKFTNVSNNIVYDEDNNCWVRTLTVKYANTLDTDFVVSEWGIWRVAYSSSGSTPTEYSNSSSNVVLVWRELLDKPITIAANSTATLTFTLKIPHDVNAF